jgi:superfamily I DNA/RNA helicase
MDTPLGGPEREAALFRCEYPTEKAEAEGIARHISRLIGGASFFAIDSDTAAGGASPEDALPEAAGDIALLVRSAALTPPLLKALRDHGIPFEFTGERPWWEEEPARSLLTLLRNSPGPPEGSPDGTGLRGLALKGGSPAEAIRAAGEALLTSGSPAAGTKGRSPGAPEIPERLAALASLYDTLPAFLEALALRGAGDIPVRREGVRVMTIHASKGLEFRRVFIAALEEGLLPLTLYGEGSIEEERRLLYVAMTRARHGLYLSWARKRKLRGRKLEGGPSRFLKDLETLVPPGEASPSRPRDPQNTFAW